MAIEVLNRVHPKSVPETRSVFSPYNASPEFLTKLEGSAILIAVYPEGSELSQIAQPEAWYSVPYTPGILELVKKLNPDGKKVLVFFHLPADGQFQVDEWTMDTSEIVGSESRIRVGKIVCGMRVALFWDSAYHEYVLLLPDVISGVANACVARGFKTKSQDLRIGTNDRAARDKFDEVVAYIEGHPQTNAFAVMNHFYRQRI